MGIKILKGDCRKTLQSLPSASINTCITSPPYFGLRNYGVEGQLGLEETPGEFVENLVNVFKEVKRVLRDDGTVWLNLGDSYGQQNGKGFNANANEGYVVSRNKELQEIQGNIKVKTNLPPKNLVGIPWRVAFALQADGWYLRQDIIWHKPNPMPESCTDRCTKAHEYIFLLTKSPKYYFDNEAIKEDCEGKDERHLAETYDDAGPVIQGDTNAGIKRTKRYSNDGSFKRNKRSVWTVTTKPFKGAHFATFPMDLIEPCVLAGCPEKGCAECGEPYKRQMQKTGEFQRRWSKTIATAEGSPHEGQSSMQNIYEDLGLQKQCDCKTNETKSGTVLDPFGGSGTTALVANGHNRDAIICELNDEYIDIAKKRISPHGDMFNEVEVI